MIRHVSGDLTINREMRIKNMPLFILKSAHCVHRTTFKRFHAVCRTSISQRYDF